MMKAEDTPKFARNIRSESSRLLNLIDDIIRLSQLDEGASMPVENVDMAEVTKEVFSILQDSAMLKNITLASSGNVSVAGVKRLLFEVLYNLCDNAIKYNVINGNAEILNARFRLTVNGGRVL